MFKSDLQNGCLKVQVSKWRLKVSLKVMSKINVQEWCPKVKVKIDTSRGSVVSSVGFPINQKIIADFLKVLALIFALAKIFRVSCMQDLYFIDHDKITIFLSSGFTLKLLFSVSIQVTAHAHLLSCYSLTPILPPPPLTPLLLHPCHDSSADISHRIKCLI